MLNYQKKAYIRVWMTGFGILFILGSFLLCYVFPDALTLLVGWILGLFVSVCFLFLIGMISFQMIAVVFWTIKCQKNWMKHSSCGICNVGK